MHINCKLIYLEFETVLINQHMPYLSTLVTISYFS